MSQFWQIAQKDSESLMSKIYEWRQKYLVGRQLYQFLKENFEKI